MRQTRRRASELATSLTISRSRSSATEIEHSVATLTPRAAPNCPRTFACVAINVISRASKTRRFSSSSSKTEAGRKWKRVRNDLTPFAGGEVHLRVYQFVLLPRGHLPGSAYWKELTLNRSGVRRSQTTLGGGQYHRQRPANAV